jgi:hypothetical protein
LVNVMSADQVPAATPLLAIVTPNCPAAQAGAEGIGAVGLGVEGATAGRGDEFATVGAIGPAASVVGVVAHAVNASTGSDARNSSLPGVRRDIRGTIPVIREIP